MFRFALALCALLLGCAPALAQGAVQTGSTSGTATAGANGVIGSFVTGNGVVTSSIATVTGNTPSGAGGTPNVASTSTSTSAGTAAGGTAGGASGGTKILCPASDPMIATEIAGTDLGCVP